MDKLKIALLVQDAKKATTKKRRKEVLQELYYAMFIRSMELKQLLELTNAVTLVTAICEEAKVKIYSDTPGTIEEIVGSRMNDLYLTDKLTVQHINLVTKTIKPAKRPLTSSSYCNRGYVYYLTEKTFPLWLKLLYYKEMLKESHE